MKIKLKEIKSWFTKPVAEMTKAEIKAVNEKILHYSDPKGIKRKKAVDYTEEDHFMRNVWCMVNWGKHDPDWKFLKSRLDIMYPKKRKLVEFEPTERQKQISSL